MRTGACRLSQLRRAFRTLNGGARAVMIAGVVGTSARRASVAQSPAPGVHDDAGRRGEVLTTAVTAEPAGQDAERARAPGDRRWNAERVLELAVQVLLAACLVLRLVYPKAHDVANSLAALATLAALALERLAPSRGGARKARLVLGAAAGTLLLVNLVSFLVALETGPAPPEFEYQRLQIDGVMILLAAGFGLRDARAAWRLVAVLLVAAGAWYVLEAATVWPRERGLFLGRDALLARRLGVSGGSPFLDGRLAGLRGFHTVLAMELLVLFALFLGAAPALRDRRRALAALAGAALVGGLLLMTETRLALVAGALVTVPAAIVAQRRYFSPRGRTVAAAVWLGVAVPALAAAWWWTASPERRDPAAAGYRLGAWRSALEIEARSPWYLVAVGHGPYQYVFPAAARRVGATVALEAGGRRMPHAHSVPLQTLVETGAVGLVSLAAVWAAGFLCAWGAWRRGGGEAAALAGVVWPALLTWAALGTMDNSLNGVCGVLGWLLAGLGTAGPSWEPADSAEPAAAAPSPGTVTP